jgi:hypothetical protein
MSAELLTRAEGGARLGEAFDPFLTGGRPAGDPGARHAAWTLAWMLRPPVRDLMAQAEAPLRVLIVGAEQGWLAAQLLQWGVGTVTVADPDARRLDRVRGLARSLALGGDHLHFSNETVAAAGATSKHTGWDLALLDGRGRMPGAAEGAIAAIGSRSAMLAVLSDQRAECRRAIVAAGFARSRVLHPPADAERRFIKLELAVLLARRPDPGAAAKGEGL